MTSSSAGFFTDLSGNNLDFWSWFVEIAESGSDNYLNYILGDFVFDDISSLLYFKLVYSVCFDGKNDYSELLFIKTCTE